jgi:hypothetical protein
MTEGIARRSFGTNRAKHILLDTHRIMFNISLYRNIVIKGLRCGENDEKQMDMTPAREKAEEVKQDIGLNSCEEAGLIAG